MKKAIIKINRSGKILVAILSAVVTVGGVWGVYEKFSRHDIEGEWYIEFKVESSSYKAYIGETHTQKVFFIQSDNIVTGNGEKWEYNGELLDFSAHRKLEYEGSLDGNNFKAKYILHGRDRDSVGNISVEISSDGNTMIGAFSGTAASSKGTLKGKRIINIYDYGV